MALCSQSDENPGCFVVVVVAHGGPRLESSQQSSSPSNPSNQAWYRHCASASPQDIETGIPGKKGDRKTFDVLLTLLL